MSRPPVAGAGLPLDELRLRADRRLVVWLLAALTVPVAFFAWLDLAGGAAGAAPAWARVVARLLSLAVPLAGLVMVSRARTRDAFARATFAIALAAVPILLVMLWQMPAGGTFPTGPMVMLLFIMYGALATTSVRQVVPALLLTAGLVVIRLWWLDAGPVRALFSDFVVLAFVNVTGIAIVRTRMALQREVSESWRAVHRALESEQDALVRERAARDAEAAARHDLTRLEGLITICSNCKKVQVGADAWQQIEAYVRDHSDVEFSHGICPSCARALYPEYAESDGEKQ